jgi:hypothetical protein
MGISKSLLHSRFFLDQWAFQTGTFRVKDEEIVPRFDMTHWQNHYQKIEISCERTQRGKDGPKCPFSRHGTRADYHLALFYDAGTRIFILPFFAVYASSFDADSGSVARMGHEILAFHVFPSHTQHIAFSRTIAFETLDRGAQLPRTMFLDCVVALEQSKQDGQLQTFD